MRVLAGWGDPARTHGAGSPIYDFDGGLYTLRYARP
jgi:hypothetical protein